MLILIPLGVLLVAIISLLLLPRIRQGFSSEWLIAAIGMLVTVLVLLLLRARLPLLQSFSGWEAISFISTSPFLLLDQTSWVFALSILILGVSCFLLPVKQSRLIRNEIIFTLCLILISLISILSGNLLAVALSWVSFDLLAYVFRILLQPAENPHAYSKFLIRGLFSSFLLVIAVALSSGTDQMSAGTFIQSFPYSLASFSAVIVRLGAGFHHRVEHSSSPHHTYLTHLWPFLNAALAMIVAVRSAEPGLVSDHGLLFGGSTLFISLLLLLKSFQHERADQSLSYWLLLAIGLIILSTSQDQENAALLWGIAVLFASWFSIHAEVKTRLSNTVSMMLMAILFFANLKPIIPPTDQPFSSYSTLQIGYVLVHALWLFDFQKKVFSTSGKAQHDSIQTGAAHSIGVLILPLSLIGMLYISIGQLPPLPGNLITWSPVFVVSFILMFNILSKLNIRIPKILISLFNSIFSPTWLVRFTKKITRAFSSIMNTITLLLEGEGGVLWALLLVALLVSLITQIPMGS